MKKLYATVIGEELPRAKIVVDHFHVIKDANFRLEEARKIEEGAVKKKISKWPLLKGREKLTPRQKAFLAELCQAYPGLSEFYWAKEELRAMYLCRTKEQARVKLNAIIENLALSYDAEANRWARSLKAWREYILNYFDNKTTNAFTEGVNTKIKMIKRLSFGFRNIEVYIKKMILAFVPFTLLWAATYHTFC